jgi:chromate reductase, NAD(P)H dehydrogenase (quinone)
MIRLGILEGSLRAASLSRAAARAVPGLAPEGFACVALPNPGSLPLFDQDVMDAGLPDSVSALIDATTDLDALLIVTPEYNWSVPGGLKNALDWLSRPKLLPLAGKPVAIWSVSPGLLGGARMHESLRQVLHSLDMRIMAKPEVQIANAKARVDVAGGRIIDPATEAHLRDHLAAFHLFCATWGTK